MLGYINRDKSVKDRGNYSSEAFITGHVAGEQNSVIDPYYRSKR